MTAQIMEVYVNVAEWGRGVYGAEAAAQHYFQKPADALNPGEAVHPIPATTMKMRPASSWNRSAGRMALTVQSAEASIA